jgi:hypothetical protein
MLAISPELIPSILQQNRIGWYHLFKGRMAKAMTQFMESHYQSMPIDRKRYTGERWSKMLIRNIWNMVLQLWETRNATIHGKQTQTEQHTEQQRLQHRVRKYYEMADLLEPTDQVKVFFKDLEGMLLEDTRCIKAWLKLAQRMFSTAEREQAKPRNERKLMENYFAWKPLHKTARRKINTPRGPDDNHPD